MVKQVEKEPGRNEICPCGSGKKYKKCCGRKAQMEQAMKVATMLKLLFCLVKGLKGESILITKRTVDALPDDWAASLQIEGIVIKNVEAYRISIKKEEKAKILTPNSRIILPGGN